MYKNIRKHRKEESMVKFIRVIMVCYLVIYSIALLYNLVMLIMGKEHSLLIPEGISVMIVFMYLWKQKNEKNQKQ